MFLGHIKPGCTNRKTRIFMYLVLWSLASAWISLFLVCFTSVPGVLWSPYVVSQLCSHTNLLSLSHLTKACSLQPATRVTGWIFGIIPLLFTIRPLYSPTVSSKDLGCCLQIQLWGTDAPSEHGWASAAPSTTKLCAVFYAELLLERFSFRFLAGSLANHQASVQI